MLQKQSYQFISCITGRTDNSSFNHSSQSSCSVRNSFDNLSQLLIILQNIGFAKSFSIFSENIFRQVWHPADTHTARFRHSLLCSRLSAARSHKKWDEMRLLFCVLFIHFVYLHFTLNFYSVLYALTCIYASTFFIFLHFPLAFFSIWVYSIGSNHSFRQFPF